MRKESEDTLKEEVVLFSRVLKEGLLGACLDSHKERQSKIPLLPTTMLTQLLGWYKKVHKIFVLLHILDCDLSTTSCNRNNWSRNIPIVESNEGIRMIGAFMFKG